MNLRETDETTAEELYEVLDGVHAGGTTTNQICETTDD